MLKRTKELHEITNQDVRDLERFGIEVHPAGIESVICGQFEDDGSARAAEILSSKQYLSLELDGSKYRPIAGEQLSKMDVPHNTVAYRVYGLRLGQPVKQGESSVRYVTAFVQLYDGWQNID